MTKLRSLILNTINIRCIKLMRYNIFGGLEHPALLRTLPLCGSLNRCKSDFANALSKFLAMSELRIPAKC